MIREIKILILFFLIFLPSQILVAQKNCVIKVQTQGIKSNKVKAVFFEDYISYSTNTLDEKISETGKLYEFKLNETSEIRLICGNIEKVFIAEPGKTYDLIFKNDSSSLPIFLSKHDSTEINYMAQKLNSEFNEFVFKNEGKIALGGASKEIKVFTDQLKMKYGNAANPYFAKLNSGLIGELEMMSRTKSETYLYKTYFEGKALPFRHSEMMLLFSELFSDKLKEMSVSKYGNLLKEKIRQQKPSEEIDSLLLMFMPFMNGKEFRQATMLLGFQKLYFDPDFNKADLLFQVKNIQKKAANTEMALIAERVFKKMDKPYPGKVAPDFEYNDTKGEIHRLSELNGKIVYLCFFNPHSEQALAEISAMPELIKNFGKYVECVALAADINNEELEKISKLYRFSFPVYNVVSNETLRLYNVNSNIEGFVIYKDGTFAVTGAQSPSNGADIHLHKLTIGMTEKK